MSITTIAVPITEEQRTKHTDFRNKINMFKEELKNLAKEIRFLKSQRKPVRPITGTRRAHARNCAEQARLKGIKFRHMHIAYCILRGKEYSVIEPKVRKNNEPNMKWVEKIILEHN